MTGTLHCYSFHSVKGGVGKSTLSVISAIALAHEHPEIPVFLVDMDLTGTSLADVLPLLAPKWDGLAPDMPIDLLQAPSGFHTEEASRERMEERRDAEGAAAVGVPFLNDYLLFQTPSWDEETDVAPAAIAWGLRGGPDNLRVFPSSALPRDLERTLPVIYDEEHAAYLEGRLEYLLDALVSEDDGEVYVVFDTPPTIPGLSRSVLSLALRLSRQPKRTLARDEEMPPALHDATVDWRAYLVATLDRQDIRAAARWLPPDSAVVRLALNRVGSEEERNQLLRTALRKPAHESTAPTPESPEPAEEQHPYLDNPIWIEEDVALRELFRGDEPPPNLRKLLRKLDEDDEEEEGA
jgi:hypothetical protein